MSYSFRLAARVLLYASSHRQNNTYNGLCYTSRGALAETRNINIGLQFCLQSADCLCLGKHDRNSAVLTHGRPLGIELLWAPRHHPPLKRGPLLLVGPCFWWAHVVVGPLLLVGPCSWWAPAFGGALLLVAPDVCGPLLLVGL